MSSNNFKLKPENIYTSLLVAKKEIWKRWKDKKLERKVNEYIKPVPTVLRKKPRAFLPGHIASPDKEYVYFLDLAGLIKLNPLGWEYQKDKFYTVNPDKLCLGKLYIYGENGSSKGKIISKKIVNFKDGLEGMRICDIKTLWNEKLADFHHRLPKLLRIPAIETYDASEWYKLKGKNVKENYKHYLALFIRNGILFENSLISREEKFIEEVFKPAYHEVTKKFGCQPLIYPLIPRKDEDDLYWYCYPDRTQAIIDKEIDKFKKSQ